VPGKHHAAHQQQQRPNSVSETNHHHQFHHAQQPAADATSAHGGYRGSGGSEGTGAAGAAPADDDVYENIENTVLTAQIMEAFDNALDQPPGADMLSLAEQARRELIHRRSGDTGESGPILRNFSGCTIFRGPPLPSFPLPSLPPLALLPSPSFRSRSLMSRAP